MNDGENLQHRELTEEELDAVAGGFTEGETLRLKSGRTSCAECGMKNITAMTYCRTETRGWRRSCCPAATGPIFRSGRSGRADQCFHQTRPGSQEPGFCCIRMTAMKTRCRHTA